MSDLQKLEQKIFFKLFKTDVDLKLMEVKPNKLITNANHEIYSAQNKLYTQLRAVLTTFKNNLLFLSANYCHRVTS